MCPKSHGSEVVEHSGDGTLGEFDLDPEIFLTVHESERKT